LSGKCDYFEAPGPPHRKKGGQGADFLKEDDIQQYEIFSLSFLTKVWM